MAGTTFRVADLGGTPLAPTADLDGDGVREPLATELDGVVDRVGTVRLSVTRTGTVTRLTRLAVRSYGKPLSDAHADAGSDQEPDEEPDAEPEPATQRQPTAVAPPQPVAPAVAPSSPRDAVAGAESARTQVCRGSSRRERRFAGGRVGANAGVGGERRGRSDATRSSRPWRAPVQRPRECGRSGRWVGSAVEDDGRSLPSLGMLTSERDTRTNFDLTRFALGLTRKEAGQRVCYLPTAVGDSPAAVKAKTDEFAANRSDVAFSVLTLFTQPNVPDVRHHLLAQDLILVEGGSVVNLMAVWRAHGLPEIMREYLQRRPGRSGPQAGVRRWSRCEQRSEADALVEVRAERAGRAG